MKQVYAFLGNRVRFQQAMLDDVQKAWYSRTDDVSGRAIVGSALNDMMLKEATNGAALKDIGRVVDCLGLRGEGERKKRCPLFYLKKGIFVKWLLSCWGRCVQVTTFRGILYGDSLYGRGKEISETWRAELLNNIDPSDMKQLFAFLSDRHNRTPPPPRRLSAASNTSCVEQEGRQRRIYEGHELDPSC